MISTIGHCPIWLGLVTGQGGGVCESPEMISVIEDIICQTSISLYLQRSQSTHWLQSWHITLPHNLQWCFLRTGLKLRAHEGQSLTKSSSIQATTPLSCSLLLAGSAGMSLNSLSSLTTSLFVSVAYLSTLAPRIFLNSWKWLLPGASLVLEGNSSFLTPDTGSMSVLSGATLNFCWGTTTSSLLCIALFALPNRSFKDLTIAGSSRECDSSKWTWKGDVARVQIYLVASPAAAPHRPGLSCRGGRGNPPSPPPLPPSPFSARNGGLQWQILCVYNYMYVLFSDIWTFKAKF